jgi:hypothetical protein
VRSLPGMGGILVVTDEFDLVRSIFSPNEANSKLVVHADRPLPITIGGQCYIGRQSRTESAYRTSSASVFHLAATGRHQVLQANAEGARNPVQDR